MSQSNTLKVWGNSPPVFTLLLAGVSIYLLRLPTDMHQALYFDYGAITSGEWWRLLSGHWLHADWQHLSWNLVGLAVLGGMIEVRSRRLLVLGLFVGTVGVSLWLCSPWSTVARYCGLSGLLNTLLGLVLYCCWRETHSKLVIFAGLLCLGKVVIEILGDRSLFTDISWPPYASAHLAGLFTTPVVIWLYAAQQSKVLAWQTPAVCYKKQVHSGQKLRNRHGNLGASQ